MTNSGQVMGTTDYIAPEQAFDSHKVDIRADIYSLGCTLYKLLTGQAPFAGPAYDSPMKKLMAHVQQPVPPVTLARPELPKKLVAVLDRLLAKRRKTVTPPRRTRLRPSRPLLPAATWRRWFTRHWPRRTRRSLDKRRR